jgi:SAM-dependent methyltransferase
MYADADMARTFDDRRFGGPIGELVARTQGRVLANMVGRIQDRDILDVGTGTGRAALLLAHGAARVTAVDASEEMLAIARRRAAEELVSVQFLRGDAHALDFADRSFDVAVAFRLLMHTPQWQRCIAELCRVAERLVVIDYPSATSVALFESLGRRVAHAAGVRTEPYRVFTHGTIVEAFARCGFRVRSVHRQFVMPIAFHKAIGSRRFTIWSEHKLDRLGLLKPFGSPVTLVAERCAPS